MGSSGLEPPTSRLSGARSNRLSYRPEGAGSHLLSHTVASAVSSAVPVLTIVFGMGTGVAPGRIATSKTSYRECYFMFALLTFSRVKTHILIFIYIRPGQQAAGRRIFD